jgi:predicted Zn-dependent peptidase
VRHGSFPEAELERERQVILQEFSEDEEDPLATAYKLFDKACFGLHPLAQPVIGTRANIRRISRAELLDYVARQYGGCNVVVGVAGGIEHEAVRREAEAAFGTMPRGTPNRVDRPAYVGGGKSKRQAGYSQTHVVLGFPVPGLAEPHAPAVVAAALFGEGMSSPLMDRIRERLGLVYYASCSADVFDVCGQFVIEASTSPEHLDRFFEEVARLLAAQAETIDPVALERARNQIAVRTLGAREKPFRRLEEAAQDLFVFGRVRSRDELMAEVHAVTPAQLRTTFETLLSTRAAVALAGKVPQQAGDRVVELVARRA